MKPFNLEEAIAGKPICTRKGLPARLLDTNLKGGSRPVVAAVLSGDCRECLQCYSKDGKLISSLETEDDLVMRSQEHVGWINIYENNYSSRKIYKTKAEAYNARTLDGYTDTIQIAWEE